MPIRISRVLEPTIYTIRGRRVIIDFDLAKIYDVATKRLNEQLRRNRHPEKRREIGFHVREKNGVCRVRQEIRNHKSEITN